MDVLKSEVNKLNIVYWKVLNTALYHTKVLLGFSSKHTQVDIPLKESMDKIKDEDKFDKNKQEVEKNDD